VARTLGNGNVSMGVRWAVRFAHDRHMRPVTLTTLLRSAAVLAAELEAAKAYNRAASAIVGPHAVLNDLRDL